MNTTAEEKFVEMIIDEVNGFKRVDTVQKQISEYIIKYLLSFRTKTVTFHLMGLAEFCFMKPCRLTEPYDFSGKPELEKLSKVIALLDLEPRPYEFLMLIESTLGILMTFKINESGIRMSSGLNSPMLVGHYSILSRLIRPVRDGEYFDKEITVEFSDDFWIDFLSCN